MPQLVPPPELPAVFGELVRQLASFLALLLGAAVLHKAYTPAPSIASAAALTRSSGRLARAALIVAAALEAAACALLLTKQHLQAGALLAALLFTLYFGALARALRAGDGGIDCGCHFGASHGGVETFDLTRNAVLAALAVLVCAGAGAIAPPLEPRHLLAGAGGLALYVALDAVRGAAHERRRPA
jgi:hypothetical protein